MESIPKELYITVLLALSKVLAECVPGQYRLPFLVAYHWMKAPCFLTVLNMLSYTPHQCPIVKDLVMDVSVGWVLMGMQPLHLTLWLPSTVCCTGKSSLPQSCQTVVGATEVFDKSVPGLLERMDWIVCSKGSTKQWIFYPCIS